MRLLIYTDESADKGPKFSDFYGGALLFENARESIEADLQAAKQRGGLAGEAKWTKIAEANEHAYIHFVDRFFDRIVAGDVRMRVMFTQNSNLTHHLNHDAQNRFFLLYYQFLKHAFGLEWCNPARAQDVHVKILLDDAPDSRAKLEVFRTYVASLSTLPEFSRARVNIAKSDIAEIDSREHVILQAVDVILGAMQFRLNGFHRVIPPNSQSRGKRTRAKERVYRHIVTRIRNFHPYFNIGISTGTPNGHQDRWTAAYRHWCFIPTGSIRV